MCCNKKLCQVVPAGRLLPALPLRPQQDSRTHLGDSPSAISLWIPLVEAFSQLLSDRTALFLGSDITACAFLARSNTEPG